MYKVLNIGGKDYKLEYSIEASLYADCVSSISGMFTNIGIAGELNDVKKFISEMSNIPQIALTIFYAGLMEAHGTHPQGDGTVPDIHTAKKLISQYIKEHAEDETGNFLGVMQICIEQMGEDGFFNLVGLAPMMELMTGKAKQQKKSPQDHRKPSGK